MSEEWIKSKIGILSNNYINNENYPVVEKEAEVLGLLELLKGLKIHEAVEMFEGDKKWFFKYDVDIKDAFYEAEEGHITKLNVANSKLLFFPECLCRLSRMKKLNISYNWIKTIPDSISLLKSLESLDLRNNKIRTIPKSIGSLNSLRKLDLCNNKIKKLPDSIKTLNLEKFWY